MSKEEEMKKKCLGFKQAVRKHLKGDVKGYEKEIKHLKEEVKEDKDLMRKAKKTKTRRGK